MGHDGPVGTSNQFAAGVAREESIHTEGEFASVAGDGAVDVAELEGELFESVEAGGTT